MMLNAEILPKEHFRILLWHFAYIFLRCCLDFLKGSVAVVIFLRLDILPPQTAPQVEKVQHY